MLLVHISRQEFERKRQIEIERQLARQREIRMQAQEEKKRAEQQRLAARSVKQFAMLLYVNLYNKWSVIFGNFVVEAFTFGHNKKFSFLKDILFDLINIPIDEMCKVCCFV